MIDAFEKNLQRLQQLWQKCLSEEYEPDACEYSDSDLLNEYNCYITFLFYYLQKKIKQVPQNIVFSYKYIFFEINFLS